MTQHPYTSLLSFPLLCLLLCTFMPPAIANSSVSGNPSASDSPSVAPPPAVIKLSRPGKPYRLEVANGQGSVTVEGYPGLDIIVSVDHQLPGQTDTTKQVFTVPQNDFLIQQRDNQVTIHARDSEQLNNVHVKIPAGSTEIRLSTNNKGNIDVRNVGGAIEINHHNGNINLQQIAGSVVASTLNGKIEASFLSVAPGVAMAFSNLNGDIHLLVPTGFHANCRLKSPKGDIIFRYFGPAGYKLNKETNSNWAIGEIGGGGPELQVSSMHGNIIIQRAPNSTN